MVANLLLFVTKKAIQSLFLAIRLPVTAALINIDLHRSRETAIN